MQSKEDSYIIYATGERALKKGKGRSKIIRKSSLNFIKQIRIAANFLKI